MLPPPSGKNNNFDRKERKLADVEGIWNDAYSHDDNNDRRSSVYNAELNKEATTPSSKLLAPMVSPKGNVNFQSASSEQKESDSNETDDGKLVSDNNTQCAVAEDVPEIEQETIKIDSLSTDDEEEEGYLTAEEDVNQIEKTIQDLESCNETKDQTNLDESNNKRTSVGQDLTSVSYDLSSCSHSITDVTVDCAIVDGCSNMSYEWQDIYPETPERGIRISNASSVDNQNALHSPSALLKSPLKSPDRPSGKPSHKSFICITLIKKISIIVHLDANKPSNQAKKGEKV